MTPATGLRRMLGAAAAALVLPASAMAQDPVAVGKYLVDTSGCHDCHTPWHMGPNGPEPDMSRALSGHPQDIVDRRRRASCPSPGSAA